MCFYLGDKLANLDRWWSHELSQLSIENYYTLTFVFISKGHILFGCLSVLQPKIIIITLELIVGNVFKNCEGTLVGKMTRHTTFFLVVVSKQQRTSDHSIHMNSNVTNSSQYVCCQYTVA